MNKVQGEIIRIEVAKDISIVTVAVTHDIILKAIVIETPDTATYLQEEQKIGLLFKETEVIIAVEETPQISLQNKIPATILAIDQGKLLSKISLDTAAGKIISLISTAAVSQLDLAPKKQVTAMIKLNEVMLTEL